MIKPVTTAQAIALAESRFWVDLTPRECALFQLTQDKLCMPFDVFHEAVEKALGRPVYTHEFVAFDRLLDELEGNRDAPTLEDILDLIPADKCVVVLQEADDA